MTRKVLAGPAMPVSLVSDRPIEAGAAIPVAPIDDLATQAELNAHTAEFYAHMPIGAIIEASSNPDVNTFAPLDGRWVTRASCPQLSALWPHPQLDVTTRIVTLPMNAGIPVWIHGTNLLAMCSGTASTDIMYSADGVNWSITTLPVSSTWRSLSWVGGLYVAIPTSGSTYYTSPDLANWTSRNYPSTFSSAWAVNNGSATRLVVLSTIASSCAYTDDGINWASTNPSSIVAAFRLDWIHDRFVMPTFNGSTTPIYWSTDGETWQACVTLPYTVSASVKAVTYANSKWYAFTQSFVIIFNSDFSSVLGLYRLSGLLGSTIYAVAYSNGEFLALSATVCGISKDGICWNAIPMAYSLSTMSSGLATPHNQLLLNTTNSPYIIGAASMVANSANLYLPNVLPLITGHVKYVRVDGPVTYVP